MRYFLKTTANLATDLPKLVGKAEKNDVIEVPTESAKNLGERAAKRMGKENIYFVVNNREDGYPLTIGQYPESVQAKLESEMQNNED